MPGFLRKNNESPLLLRRRLLRGITPGWVATYAAMLLLVAFTALPFVYLIASAFKPLNELTAYPPTFLVQRPTIQNFMGLVSTFENDKVPFSRYFFNSIITTSVSVFGNVLICCLGAYAVEKIRMPGHKLMFKFVIWGLMFSPPAAQIPIYIMMNEMGLRNTYWALIVPSLATPIYFFLVKQFVTQVPDAIIESSRIDGAGEWRTFFAIIMPMIKPAWSTVVVFSFIENWNNAGGSSIYITNQAMKTLPYALSTINDAGLGLARLGAAAAAALLTTVPVIIIYLLMQKKVMNTMAHAGIKE